MDKDFCVKCKNLLVAQTANDVLAFRCVLCNTVRMSDPEDTLRFEEVAEKGMEIYASIFDNLAKDPVNPKVEKPCPNKKCKGKFSKFARLGEEMHLISTCMTCGTQWQGV